MSDLTLRAEGTTYTPNRFGRRDGYKRCGILCVSLGRLKIETYTETEVQKWTDLACPGVGIATQCEEDSRACAQGRYDKTNDRDGVTHQCPKGSWHTNEYLSRFHTPARTSSLVATRLYYITTQHWNFVSGTCGQFDLSFVYFFLFQ